jgi:hypothetical protein
VEGEFMASNVRTIVPALCMVLSCILSVLGGPNQNARIFVDQNSDTKQLDTLCICNGNNKTINVAVIVEDAAELTGFMIHVVFDSAALKFEKAEAAAPGLGVKPFLETNGGIPGPFFVKAISAEALDIVSGVKAVKSAAVSGNGLLANLKFTCKSDKPCSVKVTKAQLSDSQLMIDTIIGQ